MSLTVDHRGDVCELRLNEPPGNILDHALCLELAEAIRRHSGDRDLKAFLLTAAGPNFSYGASIPEHEAGKVERFLPAFHDVVEALMDAAVPAVAAVRGQCLGGAFELAAVCNFLLAESSATFAVPEIRLGVLPPVACVVFPWRLGGALAEGLILTGRPLSAEDGVRCGLVTQLCRSGELESDAQEFLERHILPRSAAALRLANRGVRAGLKDEIRRRLPELEQLYLEDVMATHDANEGIRSFLEKREPVWTNS